MYCSSRATQDWRVGGAVEGVQWVTERAGEVFDDAGVRGVGIVFVVFSLVIYYTPPLFILFNRESNASF